MTRDEIIDTLWGQSNHGTRREDIEAAFNAGERSGLQNMDAKQAQRIIEVVERFAPALDDDLMAALDQLRREAERPNCVLQGHFDLVAA